MAESKHPCGIFKYIYPDLKVNYNTFEKSNPVVTHIDTTVQIIKDIDMDLKELISNYNRVLRKWSSGIGERTKIYVEDFSTTTHNYSHTQKKLINIQIYIYKKTNLKWKEIGKVIKPVIDDFHQLVKEVTESSGYKLFDFTSSHASEP